MSAAGDPRTELEGDLAELARLAARACTTRPRPLLTLRHAESPLERVRCVLERQAARPQARVLKQASVELLRESLLARERVVARLASFEARGGMGFGAAAPTPANLVDLPGRGISPGYALPYFRRCQRQALAQRNFRLLSYALTGLARIHLTFGRRDLALLVLDEALRRYDTVVDPLFADVHRARAEVFLARGDVSLARASLRRAFDLALELESTPLMIRTLRTAAELLRDGAYGDGARPRALGYFLRGAALALETDHEVEFGLIGRGWADFAKRSGDPVARFLAEQLRDAVDALFRELSLEAWYEEREPGKSERAERRKLLRELERVSHLRVAEAADANRPQTTSALDTRRSMLLDTEPSPPATQGRVA